MRVNKKETDMSSIDFEAMDFETMIIHAGQEHDSQYGAMATPIYQTASYCHNSVEEAAAKFAHQVPGFHPIYTRSGNPTTRALERKCAAMEGGEDAVAAASGMGAIGSALIAFLKAGDHIIFDEALYGATDHLAVKSLPELGIQVSRVDLRDLEALKNAIRPNTKVVYFETPNNPVLRITDVAAVKAAVGKDIRVVVDSTFAPPPAQHVLKLGADVVVHSVTKYINGHGDAVGGIVVGSAADIALVRGNAMTKLNGCPISPFNSYLILRGMKTLALRMRQCCASAAAIAEYLEANPYVEQVNYPGLKSHPQYELACRQMENGMFGGMISFELKDGINGMSSFEAGKKLVNHLGIATLATSLGDPDTLVSHPASMTHAFVEPAARRAVGITDGLVRMSVGLESAKDLIGDFERVFRLF